MRAEWIIIHHALHTNQHSVEVNGIHRIIKRTSRGRRYTIFVDYDLQREWMLIAVRRKVTVVIPMLVGYVCAFDKHIIKG